jgi:Fe2+ transport system protein FeoA
VRVVQGDTFGPLIIAFKDDARLALGRGVAHKIEVEPLNG